MARAKIITLAGVFATVAELQSYCNTQYNTLERCHKEIEELQGEIRHLRTLLEGVVPSVAEAPVSTIVVSDDQAICEMQIQRIKAIAMDRLLTVDETKQLEILMKSLYLAKKHNSATLEANATKLSAVIDHKSLLQIATAPLPEPAMEPEEP